MQTQLALYKTRLFFITVLLAIPLIGYSNIADFTIYLTNDKLVQSTTETIIDAKLFTNKLDNHVVNQGLSIHPFYIMVVVNNKSYQEQFISIANPLLDEVTIYYSLTDSIRYTETTPTKNRFFNDPNYIFPLRKDTIFFKIITKESIQFDIVIGDKSKILTFNQTSNNILFFYIGLMLVMFLFNFFILINTKDKSYLYYIIYILFVALTQLTFHGFILKYLPSSFDYLKINAVYYFGSLSGLGTLLFVSHFIDTKKNIPKLHFLINIFILLDIVAILFVAIGYQRISYKIIDINAGLGSLVVLILAIIVAKKGNRSARHFLIAWSLFLGSVIVFVLKNQGLIPLNAFTNYILIYGSAIEVTLLSFALADKINVLKEEKELAQEQALSIAHENAEIIKLQNLVLEQKVMERTTSLTETNNNLAKTLTELKQTQTQLVESEKMASLGQLTAGIAHEINNPINFVTSNVKPLERDINELYKLQEETEKIIENDADIINKIKQLKDDLDFDYLKTEISFLLKGIHEGSSRTAEIVKGLRIFSRVDEDDIKLANINEGMDSTITIINNQLNNKIEIIKEYANLPLIECFPGKLNQVFLNLISNGIYAVKQKFDDVAGGEITIRTVLKDDDVIISITDNGTGMSPETKNKLFEPFFTTKPVGDGTGLGLSIVYNTIKKHNGTLSVDTELGIGTTFTITLPQKYSYEQS